MMEPIELAGCAIIEDEKVLLPWKIKHEHYEFPGGKVENSETCEEAAIRETREELGCEVKIIRYFGHYDFHFKEKYLRSHVFIAELKQGCVPKIMEKDKFSKLIRMPIKDYKKYPIAPNVESFCEKYLAEIQD